MVCSITLHCYNQYNCSLQVLDSIYYYNYYYRSLSSDSHEEEKTIVTLKKLITLTVIITLIILCRFKALKGGNAKLASVSKQFYNYFGAKELTSIKIKNWMDAYQFKRVFPANRLIKWVFGFSYKPGWEKKINMVQSYIKDGRQETANQMEGKRELQTMDEDLDGWNEGWPRNASSGYENCCLELLCFSLPLFLRCWKSTVC